MTIRAGGRTAAYVAAIRQGWVCGADSRRSPRSLPAGVRAAAGDDRGRAGDRARSSSKPPRTPRRRSALRQLPGSAGLAIARRSFNISPAFRRRVRALSAWRSPAAMSWPPSPTAPSVAPARVVNGFVVAVRGEPAPLTLARLARFDRAVARPAVLPEHECRHAGRASPKLSRWPRPTCLPSTLALDRGDRQGGQDGAVPVFRRQEPGAGHLYVRPPGHGCLSVQQGPQSEGEAEHQPHRAIKPDHGADSPGAR